MTSVPARLESAAEGPGTITFVGSAAGDAPVDRVAVDDVPMPYHQDLLEAVLPSVDIIRARMEALLDV